jgi:hypothetical protein
VEVQNDGLAAGGAKIKAAERPALTVPMKSIILVLRSIGFPLVIDGIDAIDSIRIRARVVTFQTSL